MRISSLCKRLATGILNLVLAGARLFARAAGQVIKGYEAAS